MNSFSTQVTSQQLQLLIQVELAKEYFNIVIMERSKLWSMYFYDTFVQSLKKNLQNVTAEDEEEIKKFIFKHIVPSIYVDFLSERVHYIVQLKLPNRKNESEMPSETFYQFPLTPDNLLIQTWENHKKYLNEKINEFVEKIYEITNNIIENEKRNKEKKWLVNFWKKIINFEIFKKFK